VQAVTVPILNIDLSGSIPTIAVPNLGIVLTIPGSPVTSGLSVITTLPITELSLNVIFLDGHSCVSIKQLNVLTSISLLSPLFFCSLPSYSS
jgi:hypothetical protein